MKEPFGKYIAAIYRHQQILINHHLKPYGIGSGQYIFLINIHENQGISQKELSKLVKIDKATTAKALKKLEGNEYIYRVIDKEDKRYNKLYVTEKGLGFIPILMKILDNITDTFIAGVSNKQYTETVEVLKLILDNVQTSVEILRVQERI
jgi:DNA-binding MarR family transcriptional regulator